MGISASSLLDETKSNYIRGQAEAAMRDFSPYYRKQFSVARFSQAEEDLEQHKVQMTQLLKQREAPEEAEVLYEEGVLYFDETRKWRERYVVVRANYCLECHESLETFVKGAPPLHKLLPTGGTVLITEEMYMAMVDKCFPDDTSVKEDFAPPLAGMPGQFPVYLRLPYRRDSYFCFRQQKKQEAFLSILSDCIRHQNQDFLKKRTCEVQAFLKAVQFYREAGGRYEAWDMLTGSDVRVLGNLVMEQLLPSLEKEMLPRLKAKRTEKQRVWFATVEAVYILAQEHLLQLVSALKEECWTSARQQEVLIHSDMDQIVEARRQLEEKVRAKVSEPAEKLCSEAVQPYLASVLEVLMEPLSAGFQEGRRLSEALMDEVCQDAVLQGDHEQLKKALVHMARPNLLRCYQKIGSLQDKRQQLLDGFGFSNITGVIHSAQIDLQQLMENAVFTFEQLLYKAFEDNPDNASAAIDKAKHRVLKQYDYDSSTTRKRISREALVSITLPFIKKNLNPTCRTELQGLDQFIDADHSHFIHVENVYEDVLLQTLDREVTTVVKEAASLQKFHLFADSRDPLSQSSLSSPSASTPGSPALPPAAPSEASPELQPPSPLAVSGLSSSQRREEQQEDAVFLDTPPEAEQPQEEDGVQAVRQEMGVTTPLVESTNQSGDWDGAAEADPASQELEAEPAAEPRRRSAAAPEEEILSAEVSMKTDAGDPDPSPGPPSASAEGSGSQTGASSGEVEPEAPPGGRTPEDTGVDQQEGPAVASDCDSLDASVGSESPPSDPGSGPEGAKVTQSSEEGSTASDVLEDPADLSRSPVSSDHLAEDPAESSLLARTHAESSGVEAGANIRPQSEEVTSCQSSEPAPSPEAPPPDSIREIRDLVVEVIEVEELVQRYPGSIPKEE